MEFAPMLRAQLRNKVRLFLIVGQMAVTLAIVANCVTLIRDARTNISIQSGLAEETLVFGIVSVPSPKLRDDDTLREAWFQELLEQLRQVTGVQSLTGSSIGLWLGTGANLIRAASSQDEWLPVATPQVDEFFPDTMGVVIEEGRWFTHDEVQQSTRYHYALKNIDRPRLEDGRVRAPYTQNVVISRSLGRRLFGEGPLLGRVIEDRDGDTGRVIGVVQDIYMASMKYHHTEYLALYCPGAGHSYQYGARFYARAEAGKAEEVARRINEYMQTRYRVGDHSAWPVVEWRNTHFGPQRMLVALMSLLVILLLFVASLSTAGLTSFSVTERTRQIGVRRALGATPNDILLHFLTETGIITTIGLALGAGLSIPLNIGLLKFYDGAKLSPSILAECVLLLFLVALGSALPAARRASKVSPAIATRNV